jgi:Ca2+/H+ antiporter, TMEM165/GDT1 family
VISQVETFFTSTLLVTLAEMGDKTQLLAFALSSRFRKPWTVMAGILVATVLNHALAALLGGWVMQRVPPLYLTWALGLSFVGFGIWTLFPDSYEDETKPDTYGPFVTTAILFFFAEIGDKTQLATVALGAKYSATLIVVMGTTLGMMIADGLAVFLGGRLEGIISVDLVRKLAAGLFIVLGVVTVVSFYWVG